MTIGGYLAATRRRQGVDIETVADETKIRSDYLLRIEADELEFLAPLYVRGFLRNYARFLRVNPEPLIEAFDERYAGTGADAGRILAVNRSTHGGLGTSRPQTSRSTTRSFGGASKDRRKGGNWAYPAVFAAVVLLSLSAVGFLNQPRSRSEGLPASASEERIAGAPEDATGEASEQAEETSAPDKKTKRPRTGRLALKQGITLAISASKAECWVQVEADGVPAKGEMLTVGERTVYQADKKMNVILGNASGVELEVNGRNIGSPWPPGTTVLPLRLPRDLKTLI